MELMGRVKSDLATMANVEQEPKLMGRNVTMTLAPLPQNKRKRHFLSDHDREVATGGAESDVDEDADADTDE